MESLALTTKEQRELTTLEGVIDQGLETFREVGEALQRIRDKRLYRATHATFGSYCRERWAFTSTHARRLIVGAEVAGQIEPIGSISNEYQARELAKVPPGERQEVFDRARADRDAATAEEIRRTRLKHLTAEALESLPAEDQRIAVEHAERRVLDGRKVSGDNGKDRYQQGRRLLERASTVIEGIGPETEKVVKHIAAALAELTAAEGRAA